LPIAYCLLPIAYCPFPIPQVNDSIDLWKYYGAR
jgi:hypothetical protein